MVAAEAGNVLKCDRHGRVMLATFPEPQNITHVRFSTAGDSSRDPVSFTIEASSNGEDWTSVVYVENYATPEARQESTEWFALECNAAQTMACAVSAQGGSPCSLEIAANFLEQNGDSIKPAALLEEVPLNWLSWAAFFARQGMEQEAKTAGASDQQLQSLAKGLEAHPPMIAMVLWTRCLELIEDNLQRGGKHTRKNLCSASVWALLGTSLQRISDSERVVEDLGNSTCHPCDWPQHLHNILFEERLGRYQKACLHQEAEQEVLRSVVSLRVIRCSHGVPAAVQLMDFMERSASNPDFSDKELLEVIVQRVLGRVDQKHILTPFCRNPNLNCCSESFTLNNRSKSGHPPVAVSGPAEVGALLQGKDRTEWRGILQGICEATPEDRDAETLVKLMKASASAEEQKYISKALVLVEQSKILQLDGVPVSTFSAEQVKEWYLSARDSGVHEEDDQIEAMAVLSRALKLTRDIVPFDSQLLSLALLMQGSRLALQISTGEGKTNTLALFAAFRSLFFQQGHGYQIILTSNEDLARRDPEALASFFGLLGLRAAHNVHRDLDVS